MARSKVAARKAMAMRGRRGASGRPEIVKPAKRVRPGKKDPDAPVKPQRTIENARVFDSTLVAGQDPEVVEDERTDELQWCFDRSKAPYVLITTDHKPHTASLQVAEELCVSIPNAEFFPRKSDDIKKMVPKAIERGYTCILIINEDHKMPNSLTVCHLPVGPTAVFKLTSFKMSKAIRGHGRRSHHRPEVILNRFSTRLGHQAGRILGAVFSLDPEFKGRSVVTWHNQRDFIFFRHHRYIFKNKQKVGLQELGPRFTLKLRSIQRGTFDSKFGDYEWMLKRHQMETSRTKFFL
ncbi:ribosome production factor 1-like [Sycon ciliatum]|uniref:ribosome production factor 1-like n=1 Tax=Sycon ciliatum TaxID=27933 RepID=UPI0020AEDCF5|eukprot:scpid80870/ scgid21266/ Ribosome production factor 1; Brix domain-containing protein 5; Ribosome biogenesis protein RPF1